MTSWALQDMRHAITTMMPDLRRYARSLTRSADAADDLVQTAYERVLTRQVSLDAIEQPASWMRCVIRNLWIDQKRSSRERLSAPLEDGEHIGTEDTERTLIARSMLMRVREVMAALPEEQRGPIMLVCVKGLSYQEAAAELNIPIGTLMSRLARGRLELARRVGLAK
ncbi:RNA polymerase sigma factor [Skermanella pratensis]|uniref:RNA polymerase sigma factor n=1 Tax=Skermanella pratensis TaxID=2233999 RepID=UPI001B3B62C4|nr:RNA polymerase sigma factor [Skermanella pratensis]